MVSVTSVHYEAVTLQVGHTNSTPRAVVVVRCPMGPDCTSTAEIHLSSEVVAALHASHYVRDLVAGFPGLAACKHCTGHPPSTNSHAFLGRCTLTATAPSLRQLANDVMCILRPNTGAKRAGAELAGCAAGGTGRELTRAFRNPYKRDHPRKSMDDLSDDRAKCATSGTLGAMMQSKEVRDRLPKEDDKTRLGQLMLANPALRRAASVKISMKPCLSESTYLSPQALAMFKYAFHILT